MDSENDLSSEEEARLDQIRVQFKPALDSIIDACCVNETLVDKDQFRVYVATVWGNAAIEPEKSGVTESELPLLHTFLNDEVKAMLGVDETVSTCFEYLQSKVGEDAMQRLNIADTHKQFILYFAGIISSIN